MLARIMAMITLGYAVICILLVLMVLVSTSFATGMADVFKSELGIQISFALSLLIGTAFLLAVPVVKFPLFFKVVGCFAIIEAPFILLIPNELIAGYVDFWFIENLLVYRIIGGPLSIAALTFVIVAAIPNTRVATDTQASDSET